MNRSHPLQSILTRCLKRRAMTVRELADTVGSDENVIRNSLSILCDRGEVRQNGMSSGRYPKQLFELVECQSFEDWMNDVATDDSKPPRGWRAVWQARCDKCGCFVCENGPGVSWSQDWSYDYDGTPTLHDPTWRCSRCTDQHGIKPTNCDESQSKYHRRNPKQEEA